MMKRTLYEVVVHGDAPEDTTTTYFLAKGPAVYAAKNCNPPNSGFAIATATVYRCKPIETPSHIEGWVMGLNGTLPRPERAALVYGELPVTEGS